MFLFNNTVKHYYDTVTLKLVATPESFWILLRTYYNSVTGKVSYKKSLNFKEDIYIFLKLWVKEHFGETIDFSKMSIEDTNEWLRTHPFKLKKRIKYALEFNK